MYDIRPTVINPKEDLPEYFHLWLVGFTEAEGSFGISKTGSCFFSIAQQHDRFLIEAIRKFFDQEQLKVRERKEKSGNMLYVLRITKLSAVIQVVEGRKYLQGYKYIQLGQLIKYSPKAAIKSAFLSKFFLP